MRGTIGETHLWVAVPLLLAAAPLPGQELAEEHYRKGAAYFQSGQLDEARGQFEEVTRLSPAEARGWKALGVTYAAQGDFKPAENPLRKACAIDPRDRDACYYLGLASYNLGWYENAIVAYGKALESARPVARVHSGLGLALEALGRSEEAERELREAVRKDDGSAAPDSDPTVELGAFLFRQGRLSEALLALEQAAKSRPDSARAHFELGKTLVHYGRMAEAVEHLERAVALDPAYAAAHLLLGQTYLRLGRTAEGKRHLERGGNLAARGPHEQVQGAAGSSMSK